MQQINQIERGEHVIILVDSIGNLASKKEVEDAMDGKSVADMSRAKQMKSLFRMVTPHLTMKDIPLVVVNHTYKEIGLYPKDIVGGGTGSYYSADNIFILGRQQEKDGTVVFNFGKYEGKPAGEVLYNDRNYYNWIVTKEFSSQVKQAVKSLLKDYANKMDKDNR
jgi:hypothetical protein